MVDSASACRRLGSGHRHALHGFCVLQLLLGGLLFTAALADIAVAATYYVDATNGDDSDTGTSEAPWKTLNRAYTWYSGAGTKVVEGDTVYFKNGNYGEFRENTDDGGSYHFHRTNWVSYKAATGHEPDLTSVSIKNYSAAGDGESYLAIDGFDVSGSVAIYNTSYVKVLNCKVHTTPVAISGYYEPYFSSYAIHSQSSENITIDDCNVYECFRGIGTNTNDANWIISGNTIHHCSEDGISAPTCNNLTIRGNTIYDLRRFTTSMYISGTKNGTFNVDDVVTMSPDASGIVSYVGSNYVYVYPTTGPSTFYHYWGADHSCILTGPSGTIDPVTNVDPPHCDGFQIHGAATNILIENNYINREVLTGVGTENGQGFKLAGHPTNILMRNNLVVASSPALISETDNFTLVNNTFVGLGHPVYGAECRVFNDSGAYDTVIDYMYNNIISRLNQSPDAKGKTVWIKNHGNNIFTAIDGGGPAHPFVINGTETTKTVASMDAMFFSPHAPNLNYHLIADATAVNFGDATYTPSLDKDGNSRVELPDAGCYEYHGPVLENIGDKSVYVNELLNFTVNATDPDGDPITYSIQNRPSGATFAGQTFSWTPTGGQVGTYQVTFIASDGSEQDTETITITVKSTNQSPTANAGPDQTAIDSDGNGSQQVTLNGSGSADPDGTIQSYVWTEGGTQIATGVNPTVTLAVGQHTITLTVTDNGGLTDTDTVVITVNESGTNQPPIANAGPDQTVTDADGNRSEQVTLNGSGSSDPGGAIQTYVWREGGSQIATGASPTGTLSVGQHTITLTVTDNGGLTNTDTVIITINPINDNSPPSVTNCSPQRDSIQVPLNNLITLHIVDVGKGVDANSVTTKVNGNAVYSGNTANYTSATGNCRRTGTKADYAFSFQANEMFDFEQKMTVAVNATDLGGNSMPEYTYSFWTEMRSFGKNKRVSLGLDNLGSGSPATVRDGSGHVWLVWHAGPAGSRDIYVAKLTEGGDSFGSSTQLTTDSADQCNPAIAVGSSDKLYVVWQDNRRGNWDVYMSSSSDGVNWSAASRISDSNDNEINPAIAVGSAGGAGIVWQQEDQTGNRDIYIATSNNGFATKAISQITTNASEQTDPAIAVNSANTVYVVWTDKRNGSNDIYGAASNSGPWTNVPIVNKAGNQSSPAIAVETAGSILHLLWVDDASGNSDIYYASTNGLPSSPVAGSSIIDDSSGRNQVEPTIAVTGSTGNNLEVFACWQDRRNVAGASGDTDLYFAEVSSDGATNIFAGDNSTNSNQSQPAIGVDAHGHPYLVWCDSRSVNPQIYYTGSTYLDSEALDSELVTASAGATVGTNPTNIASIDDVSVVVPAGACSSDVRITISKIEHPQEFAVQCLAAYDFGPSGIQFNQPVTITIPYSVPESQGSAKPYWYNALTGALTQQGITDIHDIVLSPTLHALSFKTTHFTPFYVVEGTAGGTGGAGSSGGGGGGCSVSAAGNGSIVEFLLPYMALAAVMVILKLHDTRERKARKATKSEY